MRVVRAVLLILAVLLAGEVLFHVAARLALWLGVFVIVWFAGCEVLVWLGVLERVEDDDADGG